MDIELNVLAGMVHGVLVVLNGFALFHNLRRKHWKESMVHGVVLLYELNAVKNHLKEKEQ